MTSADELAQVSRPEESSALALSALRLLNDRPVPLATLREVRSCAPELFASTSHLVMPQALTPPLLRHTLDKGFPVQLFESTLAQVKQAYRLAHGLERRGPLRLSVHEAARLQAQALELLRHST